MIEKELSDTWIHGVATDPFKMQFYREASRAYSECLLKEACLRSDHRIANFTRFMIKNSEHTWGKDVNIYLHDTKTWTNEAFDAAQYTESNFLDIQESWREQRRWGIDYSLEALEDHPLRQEIENRMRMLVIPNDAPGPDLNGFDKMDSNEDVITTGDLKIGFDSTTGGINLVSGPSALSPLMNTAHKIAEVRYQAFNITSYETFTSEYAMRNAEGQIPSYFSIDFGKPGLEAFQFDNVDVVASLEAIFYNSESETVLIELSFPPLLQEHFGAPRSVWISLQVSDDTSMQLNVEIYGKRATRIPEALWVSFNPSVNSNDNDKWFMDKLGSHESPYEAATNSSTHLHVIGEGVSFGNNATVDAKLRIKSFDAPLLCWGVPTPFPTPFTRADIVDLGVNFNLLNNVWGTNYIMWYPFEMNYDQNMKFRFQFSTKAVQQSSELLSASLK